MLLATHAPRKTPTMSDRVSASITIGGSLSPATFEKLCELIYEEGLDTGWDGPEFDRGLVTFGIPLQVMAHDVPWGSFPKLEQFCVDHGIAYLRKSEGFTGSFVAEMIIYNGQGDVLNYGLNDMGEVVLTAAEIERFGSISAVRAYLLPSAAVIPPLVIGP